MTVHQSRNLTSKRLTVEHAKSIFDSQEGAEAFRVDGLVKPKFAKDFISVLKLSASQIFLSYGGGTRFGFLKFEPQMQDLKGFFEDIRPFFNFQTSPIGSKTKISQRIHL